MPATSEPASGSDRQNETSLKSLVQAPSQRFFWSSLPPITIGIRPRSLHMIEVVMPAQPQASSSTARHESSTDSPTPPYASGMQVETSPSSQAFAMIARGNSAVWS
jgi:hypothetical protein